MYLKIVPICTTDTRHKNFTCPLELTSNQTLHAFTAPASSTRLAHGHRCRPAANRVNICIPIASATVPPIVHVTCDSPKGHRHMLLQRAKSKRNDIFAIRFIAFLTNPGKHHLIPGRSTVRAHGNPNIVYTKFYHDWKNHDDNYMRHHRFYRLLFIAQNSLQEKTASISTGKSWKKTMRLLVNKNIA